MSWHYLQEREAASSEDICSGGELLPPLKSRTTHAAFYSNGKLMESYLDSLSGTMFAPLTGSRGEEKLMSLVGDSRARTSASLAPVKDCPASVQGFGSKCCEWLKRWGLDLSLLKTPRLFGHEDCRPSSKGLMPWGIMQDGVCWGLATSARRTEGEGCGFWPTPTVCGNYNRPKKGTTRGTGLAYAAQHWSTPRASDAVGSGCSNRPRNQWNLRDAHRAREGVTPGPLNPRWVEWLMGFPEGWTSLERLETGKFQEWRQQHLACSAKALTAKAKEAERW